MQQILNELTGRMTVPNVILDGKSIGGGTGLAEMKNQGKLKPMLQQAGCSFGK